MLGPVVEWLAAELWRFFGSHLPPTTYLPVNCSPCTFLNPYHRPPPNLAYRPPSILMTTTKTCRCTSAHALPLVPQQQRQLAAGGRP